MPQVSMPEKLFHSEKYIVNAFSFEILWPNLKEKYSRCEKYIRNQQF